MRSSTVLTFGLLCALPVLSAPLGERAEVSGDWVEIGGSTRRSLPGGEQREGGENHRDHHNEGQAPGRFAGSNSMPHGQHPSKNNFPSHQQNNNNRLPEGASHRVQQRNSQSSKYVKPGEEREYQHDRPHHGKTEVNHPGSHGSHPGEIQHIQRDVPSSRTQGPGEDRQWQHDRQHHGKNDGNHHGGSHGPYPGEHQRTQEHQTPHEGGTHQGKPQGGQGIPQGGQPQGQQQTPQQGVPKPQQGQPQQGQPQQGQSQQGQSQQGQSQQASPQNGQSGPGVPQDGSQGQQQTPKQATPQKGTPEQGNTAAGTQSGAAPATATQATNDETSQGTPEAKEKRMIKNAEISQWNSPGIWNQDGQKDNAGASSTVPEPRPIPTGGFRGEHFIHGTADNHNNGTRPDFRVGTTVLPHHKTHHNQTGSEETPAAPKSQHQTPQEQAPKTPEPEMHTMEKDQQKRETTVGNNAASQGTGLTSEGLTSTSHTTGTPAGHVLYGIPNTHLQNHLPVVDKTLHGISQTVGGLTETQKREAHHHEEHEQKAGTNHRGPVVEGGRSHDSETSSGSSGPVSHHSSLAAGGSPVAGGNPVAGGSPVVRGRPVAGGSPSEDSQRSSRERRNVDQEDKRYVIINNDLPKLTLPKFPLESGRIVSKLPHKNTAQLKREAEPEPEPLTEFNHGPVQFTKPAPFANLRFPKIDTTSIFVVGGEKAQTQTHAKREAEPEDEFAAYA